MGFFEGTRSSQRRTSRRSGPWALSLGVVLGALLSAPTLWSQYTVEIGDITADVGTEFELPVEATWSQEVMGYTLVVQFDALPPIDDLSFDVTNTLVAELGPEYVQADINIFTGEATLGVLFELLPPFEVSLEVLGFPISIARFAGTIDANAAEQSIAFVPTNGLGTPALNNSFVVDNESIQADTLTGGSVTIVQPVVTPNFEFIRGDVNLDTLITLSDVMSLLFWTFQGGAEPQCHDAADADDSGHADITDAIFLLNFVFLDGATPWPPYPGPGPDYTPDDIGCEFSPFEG